MQTVPARDDPRGDVHEARRIDLLEHLAARGHWILRLVGRMEHGMLATLAVLCGLALTLALPIYPDGVTPMIGLFLGLCVVGGIAGQVRRPARQLFVLLLPWGFALLLAFLIGGLRGAAPRQALEDVLPYALFAGGLWAGRGASNPRKVLQVALAVCLADTLVSLWRMPSFEPGMRSTYFYFKITAGLPIVGLYIVGLFYATARRRRLVFSVVLATILCLGIVMSVSRGMIIASVFGLVVAAHVRKPSLLWLFGIAVAFVVVVYASTLADVGERYFRLGQASTVDGRFREIRAALGAFAEHPLFGSGLGTNLEVDGVPVAYVHNVLAYHLWKFGLFGCAALALPLLAMGQSLWRANIATRAVCLGCVAAVGAYLATSAAFKTYYLVWIYGVVAGAGLTWIRIRAPTRRAHIQTQARPKRRARAANGPHPEAMPQAQEAANDAGALAHRTTPGGDHG